MSKTWYPTAGSFVAIPLPFFRSIESSKKQTFISTNCYHYHHPNSSLLRRTSTTPHLPTLVILSRSLHLFWWINNVFMQTRMYYVPSVWVPPLQSFASDSGIQKSISRSDTGLNWDQNGVNWAFEIRCLALLESQHRDASKMHNKFQKAYAEKNAQAIRESNFLLSRNLLAPGDWEFSYHHHEGDLCLVPSVHLTKQGFLLSRHECEERHGWWELHGAQAPS